MSENQYQSPLIVGPFNMPKLPVSGLIVRLIAFLIDFALIFVTLHTIYRFAPGLMWSLGEWAPFVTTGFATSYFVLLNGPLGKGRTVGKAIFKIATTDYNGNVPTFRQSLVRTVILFPFILVVPFTEVLFYPPDSPQSLFLGQMLQTVVTVAMWIGTALTVAFNPFKQGMHDFFARTLVRPHDLGPQPTFEEMTEAIGTSWLKFHRQPLYSGFVSFGLVFVALFISSFPFGNQGELVEKMLEVSFRKDLQRAEVSLPVFNADRMEFHLKSHGFERPKTDLATTGTVTLYITAKVRGRWEDRFLPQNDLRHANELLDSYHDSIFPVLTSMMAEIEDPEVAEMREQIVGQPMVLHVLFISRLSMFPYWGYPERLEGSYAKKFPPLEPATAVQDE